MAADRTAIPSAQRPPSPPLASIGNFFSVEKKTGRVDEKRFKELNKHAVNRSRVANLVYALAHESTTVNLGDPFAAHHISLLFLHVDDRDLPNKGRKGYDELMGRLLNARIDKEKTLLGNGRSFHHMQEHPREDDQGRRIDILVPIDAESYTYNDVLLRHLMVPGEEGMRAVRMTVDLIPLVYHEFWINYSRVLNIHDSHLSFYTSYFSGNKEVGLNRKTTNELKKLIPIARSEVRHYNSDISFLAGLVTKLGDIGEGIVRLFTTEGRNRLRKSDYDKIMKWLLTTFSYSLVKRITSKNNPAIRTAKNYALMSEMTYGMFLTHLFPMVTGTAILAAANYFNSDKFVENMVKPFTMREEMYEDTREETKNPTFLPGYFPVQAVFRETIPHHLDDVEILVKRTKVGDSEVVTYNHEVIESLWVQLCFGLATPQLLFDFRHNQLVPANVGYRQINADDFSIYYRCKTLIGNGDRGNSSLNSCARIPIPRGGYLFTIDNLDNSTLNWDLKTRTIESLQLLEGLQWPLVDLLNEEYRSRGHHSDKPAYNKLNKDLEVFAVSLIESLAAKGATFPDETVVRQLPYLQSILGALGEGNRPASFRPLPEWLADVNEDYRIIRNGPAADTHLAFFEGHGYGLEHGEEDVPKGKFLYTAHKVVRDLDPDEKKDNTRVGIFG